MPALARDHVPVAAGREQRGDAKPGAGAEHHPDPVARRQRLAQRARLVGRKIAQRPGDGLEVVHDAELRPSEPPRQFGASKTPGPVGERDLLAVDGAGDGQRRRARPRAGFVKVARDRAVEVGDGIVVHDQDSLGTADGIGERKATLAATDVGEEGQAHHVTRSITIS